MDEAIVLCEGWATYTAFAGGQVKTRNVIYILQSCLIFAGDDENDASVSRYEGKSSARSLHGELARKQWILETMVSYAIKTALMHFSTNAQSSL